MRVKLLGVRGTVPVHGPAYKEFGGGTSCVFIQAGDQAVILDAGTGIMSQPVQSFFSGRSFTLLISHAHVDHLMGLPVFPPLFDSGVRCDVYLKTRNGLSAREQIERLMAPPLWPVRTDAFKADLRFHDVPASFRLGDVQVDTMDSIHPGGSTIYKLSYKGVSVVYATDFEPPDENPKEFCAFAKGCSLLMLDAQYTQEEYAGVKGFGHSTILRSVAIAQNCGAQQTFLIHHDPKRNDEQLTAFEKAVQAQNPHIRFGRGGEEVNL